MTQQTLFDPIAAQKAKERGMSVSAENKNELLETARYYADWCHFAYKRPISTDDVYLRMQVDGAHPERLGNAWGSVFRGWKQVGWANSTRVSNHSRAVRLWVRR